MKRGYFWLVLAVLVGGFVVVAASSQGVDNKKYLRPASNLRDVHGLAVDVGDSNQVWIASHDGLYVLKNDKDLYKAGSSNDDYMGFAQDPSQPNTFYTAGHNAAMTANKGFQRTDDGGRTWRLIGNGASGKAEDFHALAVSPADKRIVYGSAMGQLQISTNGGKDWKVISDAPQSTALAASPSKSDTIYAATQTGLKVSTDQGNTWSSTGLTGQVIAVTINPTNASELLAVGQQGLVKSTDNGVTWQPVTGNVSQNIMYIAYDKNNSNTVYTVAQDTSISKTTDGGVTWKKVR